MEILRASLRHIVYLFAFQLFSLSHELCKKSGSLEIMSECLPLRELLREDLTFLFCQILYNKWTHTLMPRCICTHAHVQHSVPPSFSVAHSCREKRRERDREIEREISYGGCPLAMVIGLHPSQ